MGKIKLGILGLGLIGSSILKGLYNNSDYEIFCCSISSFLEAKNYTLNSSPDLNILKNCDIIFVCSSVTKTLSYLEKLNSVLSEKTIVADVTSIKKDLLGKKFNFNFILTHPMAGSEKSGFSAGNKDLFSDCKWLIEKNNEILEKIIADLGAKAKLVDMNNHDKMCAQISHLPTILSFLLFNSVDKTSKEIASSGFRDTTRLAMTNSDLAFNMFNLNLENIEESFNKLKEELNHLKSLTDSEKISLFNEISKQRKEMYGENGKNLY